MKKKRLQNLPKILSRQQSSDHQPAVSVSSARKLLLIQLKRKFVIRIKSPHLLTNAIAQLDAWLTTSQEAGECQVIGSPRSRWVPTFSTARSNEISSKSETLIGRLEKSWHKSVSSGARYLVTSASPTSSRLERTETGSKRSWECSELSLLLSWESAWWPNWQMLETKTKFATTRLLSRCSLFLKSWTLARQKSQQAFPIKASKKS